MTWHRFSTSAKRRKRTFRYHFPVWVGILHNPTSGMYGLWCRLLSWRTFGVYWRRPNVDCLDCLCRHRRGSHIDRSRLERARAVIDA